MLCVLFIIFPFRFGDDLHALHTFVVVVVVVVAIVLCFLATGRDLKIFLVSSYIFWWSSLLVLFLLSCCSWFTQAKGRCSCFDAAFAAANEERLLR